MNLSSFEMLGYLFCPIRCFFLGPPQKWDEHLKMTENFTVKKQTYNLIKYLNLKNMVNKAVNLLDFYWSFALYGV